MYLNIKYATNAIDPDYKQNFEKILKDFTNKLEGDLDYQCFKIDLDLINSELKELQIVANSIKKFQELLIVGMGGAINNPRAVLELLNKSKIKVNYLDTIDPDYFYQTLNRIDLKNTAVLTISKSGETLETLAMVLSLVKEFERLNIENLSERFYFITEDEKSSLGVVSSQLGSQCLKHKKVGGRFATFSNIIFLPLLICDLDPIAFCEGGNSIVMDVLENYKVSMVGRGVEFFVSSFKNHEIHTNISYLTNLKSLLDWYDQVFSESLGKQNFAITPLSGLAPQNQHSHLQLYLGGKQNKSYTIYTSGNDKLKTPTLSLLGIEHTTMGQLLKAQSDALFDLFKNRNNPCREIVLEGVNEQTIGALMMFNMIEVVLYGIFEGINPFGQPAVEEMKHMVMNKLLS